jgi:Rrf2 family protein
VRRLIGKLVRGGILVSSRGSAGGIRLARPASSITMLDVVQVMEGPIALNHCLDPGHTCPLMSGCPVQSVWAEATRGLEAALGAARFDRLATGSAGHQAAHQNRQNPVH